MELNLLPVLNYDGKKMPVEVTVNLSERQGDSFSITSPIEVKGEIVNVGGCLEFSAECSTALRLTCDRCAEEFDSEFSFSVWERMKKADAFSQEDDSEVIAVDGNVIELDEIIYGALYMSLPAKALCNTECKGLCPMCGVNLNKGECSCDDTPTDPRFDILDQLL